MFQARTNLGDGIVMHLVPGALSPGTQVMPGQQAPAAGTQVQVSASSPWYMTWWGIGGLGLLGFLAYRKFKK